MTNYKRLGIEKEMNEAFSDFFKTDLQLLMQSCYFQNPYITKREGGEYVEIEVVSCKHNFWYKNLIGLTFFTKIRYRDYGRGKFVQEFLGVKLTNTKEIHFRSFKPSDVRII